MATAATVSPRTSPPIAGCTFPLSPPAPAAAPPAAAHSVVFAPQPPDADPDCDGDDDGVGEAGAFLSGEAVGGAALEEKGDTEGDRDRDALLDDGGREGNNDGGGGGGGA